MMKLLKIVSARPVFGNPKTREISYDATCGWQKIGEVLIDEHGFGHLMLGG